MKGAPKLLTLSPFKRQIIIKIFEKMMTDYGENFLSRSDKEWRLFEVYIISGTPAITVLGEGPRSISRILTLLTHVTTYEHTSGVVEAAPTEDAR